jgi:hypothetical protein
MIILDKITRTQLLNDAIDPQKAAVPLPIPGCQFPAREIRAYLKYVQGCIADIEQAKATDGGKDSDDLISAYLDEVTSIGKMRLAHEGVYGCGCWYTPEDRLREQGIVARDTFMGIQK